VKCFWRTSALGTIRRRNSKDSRYSGDFARGAGTMASMAANPYEAPQAPDATQGGNEEPATNWEGIVIAVIINAGIIAIILANAFGSLTI
jgi:hypothetical protein